MNTDSQVWATGCTDVVVQEGGYDEYPFSADYDLSFEALVAMGSFHHVDDRIMSEGCAKYRSGQAKLVGRLIPRDDYFQGSVDRLAESVQGEVRPATFCELIAFSAKYITGAVGGYQVIAIGSHLKRRHHIMFPMVRGRDERPWLKLHWQRGAIHRDARFLYVTELEA